MTLAPRMRWVRDCVRRLVRVVADGRGSGGGVAAGDCVPLDRLDAERQELMAGFRMPFEQGGKRSADGAERPETVRCNAGCRCSGSAEAGVGGC